MALMSRDELRPFVANAECKAKIWATAVMTVALCTLPFALITPSCSETTQRMVRGGSMQLRWPATLSHALIWLGGSMHASWCSSKNTFSLTVHCLAESSTDTTFWMIKPQIILTRRKERSKKRMCRSGGDKATVCSVVQHLNFNDWSRFNVCVNF